MENRLEHSFNKFTVPEPNTGCILWIGTCDAKGYGQVTFKNKSWKAHRAAWLLKFGEIPKGLHVLHKCDVRCCVNTDHLWLGTHQENMLDCAKKGRYAVSKLNAELAEEIKTLLAYGFSQQVLADAYGVDRGSIRNIQYGKSYSWALAKIKGSNGSK